WVVEDDPCLRRTVELWLRKSIAGSEVLTFSSAEPADYALAEQGPPHALVADHGLPGEQGLDWILRRRSALRGAHAVLVTGDSTPELAARACFAGVPLVIKP